MYYDYQVYAPIMAPQVMSRPSVISSGHLFQMISIALDRNLNAFLEEKNLKRSQMEQEQLQKVNKTKTSETIVIDLESEEEVEDQPVHEVKHLLSNVVKFSPVHETLLDTSHKEEILGTEQNQSHSQTSQKSQKGKSVLEKSEEEEKILRLTCSKKNESFQNFTLFSVECPKLGISNAQLLRKKQKLLRRNVADWSEVDNKGPKQRRQIRMLKN